MLQVEMGIAFGAFAMIFAAPILLLFGVPIYAILFYLEIASLWVYLSLGFVGGALMVLLFRPFGDDPIASLINQSILLGCFGVLASFVFWMTNRKWPRSTGSQNTSSTSKSNSTGQN